MEIDKNHVQTQEETGEKAAIDEVEERVEAEMKEIEGRARESVAQGLDDPEMERKARAQQEEARRQLAEQRKKE